MIQVSQGSNENLCVMKLLDDRFRIHKARYVLQCLLATVSVMIALIVLGRVINTAVTGALGASAFVAFTMPARRVSSPRFLVGGYLVGIAAGTVCYWLSHVLPLGSVQPVGELTGIVFGALAVGLAIFLMVVTNTEHPPAAGLALGIALNDWRWQTIVLVLLAVVSLAVAKRLLRPLLVDLL